MAVVGQWTDKQSVFHVFHARNIENPTKICGVKRLHVENVSILNSSVCNQDFFKANQFFVQGSRYVKAFAEFTKNLELHAPISRDALSFEGFFKKSIVPSTVPLMPARRVVGTFERFEAEQDSLYDRWRSSVIRKGNYGDGNLSHNRRVFVILQTHAEMKRLIAKIQNADEQVWSIGGYRLLDSPPLLNGSPPQATSKKQQNDSGGYLKWNRRAFRGWTVVIVAVGIIIGGCGGWFGTALIARRRYWAGGCLAVCCGAFTFLCWMWAWVW
ncbi:MAG: hypothetical protein Q7S58_10050 [Candidatus Binatus sp.]|uniref:hypothetical protein n=1 Tax=Candidatus Binatus sp. TaxID=2811406 RepID=UPI00271F69DB|nr:hypothetical protein [Candidatus Binatus sp.]MDO8432735.1 hypothetical protein [Candidatus Binatus sp.]